MSTQSVLIAATLVCSVAIASCNSATADWSKASAENSVPAYQTFLAAHPKDEHAVEAQAIIVKLQDEGAWTDTQHAGTVAAYQTYLEQSPQGPHAAAARDAITAIDRGAAWKTAQGEGTAVAIEAFLQKYPSGPEAMQGKGRLKELTGYRMHLGTESSDQRAQHKVSQLEARFSSQVHGLAVTPDASGKSFSIDSPGMTEQEANSACEALKHKNEACQVITQ